MKLHLQYMGQLRPLLGQSLEQVELPAGSDLAALLAHLAGECPEAAGHLLSGDGRIRPSLILAINGVALGSADAADTPLADGDVVSLLPPIAGG